MSPLGGVCIAPLAITAQPPGRPASYTVKPAAASSMAAPESNGSGLEHLSCATCAQPAKLQCPRWSVARPDSRPTPAPPLPPLPPPPAAARPLPPPLCLGNQPQPGAGAGEGPGGLLLPGVLQGQLDGAQEAAQAVGHRGMALLHAPRPGACTRRPPRLPAEAAGLPPLVACCDVLCCFLNALAACCGCCRAAAAAATALASPSLLAAPLPATQGRSLNMPDFKWTGDLRPARIGPMRPVRRQPQPQGPALPAAARLPAPRLANRRAAAASPAALVRPLSPHADPCRHP